MEDFVDGVLWIFLQEGQKEVTNRTQTKTDSFVRHVKNVSEVCFYMTDKRELNTIPVIIPMEHETQAGHRVKSLLCPQVDILTCLVKSCMMLCSDTCEPMAKRLFSCFSMREIISWSS